ncbi:tyrosine-type recombinase/integrase [Acetobacter sacchari]|uniref:Tyrosine-type recombinase/integrase n=1 Tax=Acetobacter sacchari TaxID=2661687 RepID=A0ABS3M157_9PROT|nr:tyrosine-type recombinase/integrase [Acetobacter sacchari]
MNIFRRGHSWAVRFHIPRERRADVGRAYGAATGHKAEIVKALGTSDRAEAIARRPKALEAIRQEVDARLVAAGLPPLHGDWKPAWAFAWSEPEAVITEALEARKEIADASPVEDETDEVWVDAPNGGLRRSTMSTSERDRKISTLQDVLRDRVDELENAGKDADAYIKTFWPVAFGEATPLGELLDRWIRDIEGGLRRQTIMGHRLAFRLLGEFLMTQGTRFTDTVPADEQATAHIRATAIETVTKKRVGEFPEWLAQGRHGLSAKTIQSRISPLKTFWDWAERKGYSEANPWLGATTGLKKRAEQQKVAKAEERPFTETEIVALLHADPDEGKRWKYGPAIFDLLRLGLLTGARQNELCSLTRGRVIEPSAEGGLWAIRVTNDVAKTKNAQRLIPIHPLVQSILERRLASAGEEPDALLFPELPPGGPDGKRSWTFAKRFSEFRKRVLGEDHHTDFHSLRRTFLTYMEEANANGASACTELVRDHLAGHKPQSLAGSTYVAKQFDRGLYDRAILGMVEKGMPEGVRAAL